MLLSSSKNRQTISTSIPGQAGTPSITAVVNEPSDYTISWQDVRAMGRNRLLNSVSPSIRAATLEYVGRTSVIIGAVVTAAKEIF